MSEPVVDLLNINCGTVTAPAGCGKTYLIAEALQRHTESKPVLVLTHTNAGVAALRRRLNDFGVPNGNFRLATLDGWCMRIAGMYPTRSGLPSGTLELTNPKGDYPAIRRAVTKLLAEGHIDDILDANFSRVIVDEYQDCTRPQHDIVSLLSQTLPICVLGDHLQAIFGWRGNEPPDWNSEVLVAFPLAGELQTPWRWRNVGKERFGQWLLEMRARIEGGQPIDLREAPEEVRWVPLDGTEDTARRIRAAHERAPNENGTVLIIAPGIRPASHAEYAQRIKGAVVVENADLRGFVEFAENFDIHSEDAADHLIDFAGKVMTGVGSSEMKRRVKSLRSGTARTPANDAEQAAVIFAERPTPANAVDVLVEVGKQPGVRPHRDAILRACIRTFNSCDDGTEFREMAIRVREQNRQVGRSVPKRAVGSTLLLKGLEADVSVILETEALTPKDLYVGMTRGSRKLVICSSSPILNI